MSQSPWDTIAVVGVGLIGGSLGQALRQEGLARRVLGMDRSQERLERARQLGAIDCWTRDLQEAANTADLVVLCTPVDLIASQAIALLGERCGPRPLIVTDCGSVKQAIVEAVQAAVPPERAAWFVPGHPLAGSERSGVEHARADLFRSRLCVLTPTELTSPKALTAVEQLWQAIGARCVQLDPETHDRFLAHTSHLPHLVAAALVHALPEEAEAFVASGFLDTTRVAGGSEEVWMPILKLNRHQLIDALSAFLEKLDGARRALEQGGDDMQALIEWWRAARVRRQQLDTPAQDNDTDHPRAGQHDDVGH